MFLFQFFCWINTSFLFTLWVDQFKQTIERNFQNVFPKTLYHFTFPPALQDTASLPHFADRHRMWSFCFTSVILMMSRAVPTAVLPEPPPGLSVR